MRGTRKKLRLADAERAALFLVTARREAEIRRLNLENAAIEARRVAEERERDEIVEQARQTLEVQSGGSVVERRSWPQW